ncbi:MULTISPECIES: hypothetical protein [unclassified Mucilaginibacter]|uniref:hypothetical protein n=1 Tax=unclassified Mucilaginibacter TaxID=2617802 RepID=UPI002AC8EAE6|nr:MULTISPECIES: hypothetical protein [unclassified Mucilaginibacter]MEB0261360.1 hypothetical protein [Mucilaginibacter sp. 10I4]MEB0278881.1 hypothetical protein [Mucilaginibacter sp. 10B2]MEB0299753.1 hypothetical protein [Mucilaginibacter sp. 5C4]WPX22063.1 hypothetical protein RHM67_12310 [Mucilaginibacter sp. 5C4]
MKLHEDNSLGALGAAIGKGLLAGIAATAAMTLSQMIEMKITKREPSNATVKVAEDTAGIKPATKEDEQKLSQELHWSYGTAWGVARGIIGLTGLKGLPATLVHFGAVWGTALIMLPKHNAAKPINEQKPQEIAIDVLHHGVYAITAGLVYDALDAGSRRERKVRKILASLKGLKYCLK